MTLEELTLLPKVELHCHLDGSLSREFVEARLGRTVTQKELQVEESCTSLAEYLEKFSLPGLCLMDEKGLEDAGYDVLKGMSKENVLYAEIRFAPLLSETADMNCRKVIEALLRFRGDYLCHAPSQPGREFPYAENSQGVSWLWSVCSRPCGRRSLLSYE